uniref:p53 n=1 Tax=Campoletis sonorensis ichnovirus TaxID=10484 RepID=O96302_CSIV|nr:p53 [Ichnoviriform sonorense]
MPLVTFQRPNTQIQGDGWVGSSECVSGDTLTGQYEHSNTDTQGSPTTHSEFVNDNEAGDDPIWQQKLIKIWWKNRNRTRTVTSATTGEDFEISKDDKEEHSAISSYVRLKKKMANLFVVAATIVNGAAVKGKGKIIHFQVLNKCPRYIKAMEAAFRDSSENHVHAFHATLRYPDEYVLAVITSPKDTWTPDGSNVDSVTTDKKYDIVIQRGKFPHKGDGRQLEIRLSSWFNQFNPKSISESESAPSCDIVSQVSSSPNEYVSLHGNDGHRMPVKPTAPAMDAVQSHPIIPQKLDDHDSRNGQPSHAVSATVYSPADNTSKRSNSETRPTNFIDFAVHPALQIGSVCALSAGVTYLLVKKPKLAS